MPTKYIRSHSEFFQVVRQLIGPRVQLPVSQLLLLKDDCYRIRRSLYLLLEQLVEALVSRVASLCIIPLHQQLMLLGLCEYR